MKQISSSESSSLLAVLLEIRASAVGQGNKCILAREWQLRMFIAGK